jgi:hypothetical protein
LNYGDCVIIVIVGADTQVVVFVVVFAVLQFFLPFFFSLSLCNCGIALAIAKRVIGAEGLDRR